MYLRHLPPAVLIVVGLMGGRSLSQTTQRDAAPPPPLPTNIMPGEELARLYSSEFGKPYQPDSPQYTALYNAHVLLEEYFEAGNSQQREGIEKEIEGTHLDAATLGRLIRIRMNWPALQPGVYYINERFGTHEVKYFLGVPPKYDRTVSWPLVIKLPVAMPFLTEPLPTAETVVAIYSDWMRAELADHPDAVVVMPLLNLTEFYGPSYEGMNTVIQPMLDVAGKVNIDPARVYMLGHSMAAHAVWNLALHYTTYFAAIAPLAGGAPDDWQRLRVKNLRNVLAVVWHDTDDKMIPVGQSQALVQEMRLLKYDVDYEETQGVGHIPGQAIVERVYKKMRARSRELYPQQVSIQSNRPDTMFNRVDWVQVYQEMLAGAEQVVHLSHGTGGIRLEHNPFTMEAALKGNEVNVTTSNVDTMRIYFNDQMVDLSQRVRVVVNGKQKFYDYIKPDIDEMLKDQLFLGRGWRYYTAVLDLDLGDEGVASEPSTAPATKPAGGGTIQMLGPNGEVLQEIHTQ